MASGTGHLGSVKLNPTPALRASRGRTSLRDEAIHTLTAAIIAGELRPRVVYSAPMLAAELGMSPTPVREAMLDLVKEGLVETIRNKGFQVVELADADLDDLTELRVLIEVPTVRKLARRGLAADEYAGLKDLAKEIELAARRRDMVAHNRADLAFHLKMLGLLGNDALVETVRSLRIRSRLYGMAALADTGHLIPTSLEHAEVLDLVKSHDSSGAARLMHRHIGHVRGSWATGVVTE